MTQAKILFLGLCAKFDRKNGKQHEPFSPSSRSGKFIRGALGTKLLPEGLVEFSNVLPHTVWGDHGRERLPTIDELAAGLATHSTLQQPTLLLIVGLGEGVKRAWERPGEHQAISAKVLFLPHPSFIQRRPVSERNDYIKLLQTEIRRVILDT